MTEPNENKPAENSPVTVRPKMTRRHTLAIAGITAVGSIYSGLHEAMKTYSSQIGSRLLLEASEHGVAPSQTVITPDMTKGGKPPAEYAMDMPLTQDVIDAKRKRANVEVAAGAFKNIAIFAPVYMTCAAICFGLSRLADKRRGQHFRNRDWVIAFKNPRYLDQIVVNSKGTEMTLFTRAPDEQKGEYSYPATSLITQPLYILKNKSTGTFDFELPKKNENEVRITLSGWDPKNRRWKGNAVRPQEVISALAEEGKISREEEKEINFVLRRMIREAEGKISPDFKRGSR
jgi:hypothetical protein